MKRRYNSLLQCCRSAEEELDLTFHVGEGVLKRINIGFRSGEVALAPAQI